MKSGISIWSAGIVALGLMTATASVPAAELDPATIAAAKTPADHEAIARAYEVEAAKLEDKAILHERMGEIYAQPGGKPWAKAQVRHCKAVVADLKAAAREDRALAAEHRKMAQRASQ